MDHLTPIMLKIAKLLAIVLLISMLFYWRTRDLLVQACHDLLLPNPPVATAAEADSVLALLSPIAYQELEADYQAMGGFADHPYFGKIKQQTFLRVQVWDLNRRIAGGLRIKHFLCQDRYLSRLTLNWGKPTYWLIDAQLLHAVIHLQNALADLGHNPEGFRLSSAYRHPTRNAAVQGASLSRHILGQAVDLRIGDINLDGRYTEADKMIVIRLAESEIIGQKGGIGKYPGTREVHLDVRGYPARWNSY